MYIIIIAKYFKTKCLNGFDGALCVLIDNIHTFSCFAFNRKILTRDKKIPCRMPYFTPKLRGKCITEPFLLYLTLFHNINAHFTTVLVVSRPFTFLSGPKMCLISQI